MENATYDYSPIISRKPFKLPNNAPLAVWIVLCVEYFDIGKPVPGGRSNNVPDMQTYAARDYGNRVGIWRIMDVLDKYQVKATLCANSEIFTHYPVIGEESKKRGWEFMAHSDTNTRFLGGLSEAEERKVISSSIATVAQAAGERPKGWRSSGMTTNFITPSILAEEGIRYISDWGNDDQPHLVNVKAGRMISLPSDNVPDLRFREQTSSDYYDTIKEHFDTLFREGVTQARTFAMCLHAFEIGQPSKIGVLDKMLKHMKESKEVWFCTGWELARWYYENYLRIDNNQIG